MALEKVKQIKEVRQIYYISLNINVLCYFKDLCLQVVVAEKDGKGKAI